MKLSEIAAIIEGATSYELFDIHMSRNGMRAKIGVVFPNNGQAEAAITVSALDLTQARYPVALLRTLTRDADQKLKRFLATDKAQSPFEATF